MPIGCGDPSGEGNIDPSPFIDTSTGQAYLYVSTERGYVNGQYVRRSALSVIPLDPGLTNASGPRVALLTAVYAVVLAIGLGGFVFGIAWGIVHLRFFGRFQVSDVGLYRSYGDAVFAGRFPYRDFKLGYPPGALPVFLVPAIDASAHYRQIFELLMLECGVAAIACVALTLRTLRATTGRLAGAVAFIALAPIALGSVFLSRYDLWPAALTAAALLALVARRYRLGFGVLAIAVAAKACATGIICTSLMLTCGGRVVATGPDDPTHAVRLHEWGTQGMGWILCMGHPPVVIFGPPVLSSCHEKMDSRDLAHCLCGGSAANPQPIRTGERGGCRSEAARAICR